ncbi:MAG TPA: threonine/serine dehydratase [Thermoanaerobaculia bacterium]|nr:threonine/serine dehydratase [Thermoanaerobaculia bacterium]
MSGLPVGLRDIERARLLLGERVRRTPLLSAGPLLRSVPCASLTLKLESLQVTGSFKARGATHKVLTLAPEEVRRGLVTASGGNHGLGVAYAGHLAGAPVTIYLPANVPPAKAEKLERWGARLVWEGSVWDEADAAARDAAGRSGATYVHAFADPAVIAGQGTIGLEIFEDGPQTDLVLVAIGGGGLISGVATAVKALRPEIRVVGVEPVGAPTLYESLRAGRVVELERIATAANTLAPRASAAINLEIIRRTVDEIVLVDDDEMRDAARWLWFETGVAAELSGAAAVAALLSGRVAAPGLSVCALVCGAGTDGLIS